MKWKEQTGFWNHAQERIYIVQMQFMAFDCCGSVVNHPKPWEDILSICPEIVGSA
jgi:hypothetical protein